jgi:hypothetical protein
MSSVKTGDTDAGDAAGWALGKMAGGATLMAAFEAVSGCSV